MEDKSRARASAFLKVIELEFVISIIMLIIATILDLGGATATTVRYIHGVAVGLIISWVTGALAYWIVGRRSHENP